ncbi:low molecular weight phosphotyrosine protein phosphatase [Pedobacter sp. ISL-68]|uniref:low molecular weight protein-tyrosine-phosphatase n=1 Tax=unclassified Pedobacter TaxID=2628915 RepID=UPI001BE5F095|nr:MULTISPECIES: low molecular weight protein-tyrosine-phosphatase [unclassified Pedobacter]MBT2559959.1 low molecular weight phosphotyrosine protein phosphatase [Pedobacter sp. ISL-64]MBT2592264.1 low molecular weight phosphotyrosine protein phosphatase [Pedobacter sp. ISL-68]
MKILMVCLGNICRSPLAEGIMRHLADKQNLNWEIASAGTGNWHIGKAPDHRSISAAKALGYDISKQRAQQFNRSMFAKYDLILVMDQNNLADVKNLAKSEEERKKVKLFLDNDEVTDPYWNNALFNPVCRQVEERCIEIIKQLS